MKKQITRAEFLAAAGLFSIAQRHYAKAMEFERELVELLGFEDGYGGIVSDALMDNRAFEQALKLQGISVEQEG